MLFTVFAFSAVVAASASASEWLVEALSFANGTTLWSETEGDVTLVAYNEPPGPGKKPTVLTEILCEGIFDGSITWPNLDLITDLLTTDSLTTIGELGKTNETPLDCLVTFDAGSIEDCAPNTLAEVWVDNLNLELGTAWETELLLPAANEWVDHFPANAGYDIRCESLFFGVTGESLCEGAVHALMSNEPGTTPPSILGEFMKLAATEAAELERGNCTLTGEHTGEVVGTGNTWAVEVELVHLETGVS